MQFINLTPHTINIKTVSGMLNIEPSGDLARVEESRWFAGYIGDIRVEFSVYSEYTVTGLPEPQDGISYIVSSLVLQAVSDKRDDVFAPGKAIRDDLGRIVACEGLSCTNNYQRPREAVYECPVCNAIWFGNFICDACEQAGRKVHEYKQFPRKIEEARGILTSEGEFFVEPRLTNFRNYVMLPDGVRHGEGIFDSDEEFNQGVTFEYVGYPIENGLGLLR